MNRADCRKMQNRYGKPESLFSICKMQTGFWPSCEGAAQSARNLVGSVTVMTKNPIFHMCRRDEWDAAQGVGAYAGSSQDVADGFIHFSTARQVRVSAAKHRAGQEGLVLLSVDGAALGAALRWEKSRGGDLFPHLYGPLPLEAVVRVDDLPLNADGMHAFPRHVTDREAG